MCKMSGTIRQAPITCNGHTRPVVDLEFVGDTDCGPLLITASKDGKAMLRAGDTGDWIGTFSGHRGAVWGCTLNSEGTRAATGAADFSAKIWNVTSGQELLTIPQDHIVRAVDLSATDSGRRLLTANNKLQVFVYDLENPSSPVFSLNGHSKTVRKCLWIDNDRRVLTISDDKTLRLWDFSSPEPENKILWSSILEDIPMDAQIWVNPTATVAKAVVAQGKRVNLYDCDFRSASSANLMTPRPAASFLLPSALNSAHMNPNGDMIVCGGDDNLLYRLDAKTGEILESCRGHFGPVHCVRFSPDGQLYASGSEDGTVRLWQTEVGKSYGLWRLKTPTTSTAAFSKSSCPSSTTVA